MLDQFLPLGIVTTRSACDQNVEVAHRFATAAKRSRRRRFIDARIRAQVLDDLFSLNLCGFDQKATGDSAIVLDGFEQLLFVLLAHARQLANLAFASEFLHPFKVADLISAPDQCDCLWSQPLHF